MENNKNNGDTPLYSISSAARMLEISVHTMRMYEKEGLILPYKKDSNHRLYSEHDIERIECIRRAIKEKKFTIPAIKAIFSFIPCWNIMNCSDGDREVCPALIESGNPCWSYKDKMNICAEITCRECEVYKNYNQCDKIRDKIKEITTK